MIPKPSILVPGSIPSMVLCLVNDVESGIRTENLGNNYSLLCLVILKQGGNYARQSQGTAVESVAESGLASLVLVAQVQTVGLEAVEVGN